ncbi:MAG: winged helix-turn-helix transcriptional regulator [Deltaproteobacteria bacterium]|nr:winged helix-turn-helix transcriptional regulator [Deltaproteobacteria bacterium]MBN2673757.1 winged helix-turn-helix transcriptional regulator [Deltaproteobacteria bacterium]
MKHITSTFKSLCEPNRLRIVCALASHPSLCACELLSLLKIRGATLSRHMSILISAGLVDSKKKGKWVHYSLIDNDDTTTIIQWLLSRMKQTAQWRTDQLALTNIHACTEAAPCAPDSRPPSSGSADDKETLQHKGISNEQ